MSTYTRVKTFVANETLTASDLNNEFNNIITNTNSSNLNSDNISTSATWIWTGVHTMAASSSLNFNDDIFIKFGTAPDYLLRYNNSNTALELTTSNSDGSGTDATVIDIQDGTDDVRIRGGLATDNNTAPTTGLKVGGVITSDTDSTDDLGTTSVRWANVYTDAIGDTGQALTVKSSDVTVYHDADNADVAVSMGTSATEALFIEALNGSSDKTLEELRFTTKTASGTGNHGKVSFYIDEAAVATIDDTGINIESGMSYRINGTSIDAGDVQGPGSATNNSVARFDLGTGKIIQNSAVIIDDSSNVSGVATLSTAAITATDTTAPLILKYDAQEYVTHAVSSAGVYSITTTDASSDSGAITLDTVDKITLDSDTADQGIVYADGGTELLSITNSSSDVIFKPLVDAKDIVIQQYDGNEVARFADNRRFYLYDEGGEYLSSDGSNLTIASGSAAWVLPASDGSANQVLKTNGSGTLSWTSVATGTIGGSTGSTDNIILTANGTAGATVQANSSVAIDDSSNISGVGTITSGAITATDTTAPLILKYDAQEFVTHAVSSAGVYSIATTDASSDSGAITLDTVDKITLDSDTADQGIVYADGGTELMSITNSSSDVIFKPLVDAKDLVFQQYDGNEVARIADNRRLYLYDEGGEYLSSDGSNLTIASGSAAWVLPASDGSANQVLKTNGSGTLSWTDAGGGGGAYSDWEVKTTNYTASTKDQLICNHASTAFTITLPSSPSAGNTVTIKNVGAATVTVGRNSEKIDSAAADGTIFENNAVQLVYVDSTIGWASL